ncbi:MAG: hypothetical protein ACK41C_15735 [Phenylobacterium sp.]|uniref:hypothetical protein n=1 Tax=Phenylobacterium sp. TaxID=1871053 RepID=UPI003918BD4B
MEAVAAWASALESSAFGMWARGSSYAYPFANLVHLLGLVMVVGGIGLLDLRLAGFFRALPVQAMWRVLTPFGIVGVVLLAASGFTMFAADAGPLVRAEVFQRKMVLIVLALANAAAYRVFWRRHAATWDQTAPTAARALALTSLMLWMTVAAFGRLIAYT